MYHKCMCISAFVYSVHYCGALELLLFCSTKWTPKTMVHYNCKSLGVIHQRRPTKYRLFGPPLSDIVHVEDNPPLSLDVWTVSCENVSFENARKGAKTTY